MKPGGAGGIRTHEWRFCRPLSIQNIPCVYADICNSMPTLCPPHDRVIPTLKSGVKNPHQQGSQGEASMQKASIRISGKWRYLKVRENVVKNGEYVREIMYHKLAPVDQFRPSSNGEPPTAIRTMADEKLAPINSGKREGLSADSWKSYLESYLASGLGADGRPVRKVTLKSYRRDYKIIKDLIPDIQLRNVRTPDINKLFKALIAADGDDIRATSSYRNVRNFLSGAFRTGVGDGLVDFNPVRDAMVVSGNDADTHAYTLAEVKQLMKVIALEDPKSGDDWKHTIRAAFMVAFFTGLRLEEIKGLKWTDYDKQTQLLHIRRTVV